MLLAILLAVINAAYSPPSYSCNGSNPTFSITFPYLSSSDLVVTSATSTLTLGVDYTVNRSSTTTTATLTLLSPATSCPSGNTLKILRNTLRENQPTSYRQQIGMNPAVHETSFDRAVMQIQELAYSISLGIAGGTLIVGGPYVLAQASTPGTAQSSTNANIDGRLIAGNGVFGSASNGYGGYFVNFLGAYPGALGASLGGAGLEGYGAGSSITRVWSESAPGVYGFGGAGTGGTGGPGGYFVGQGGRPGLVSYGDGSLYDSITGNDPAGLVGVGGLSVGVYGPGVAGAGYGTSPGGLFVGGLTGSGAVGQSGGLTYFGLVGLGYGATSTISDLTASYRGAGVIGIGEASSSSPNPGVFGMSGNTNYPGLIGHGQGTAGPGVWGFSSGSSTAMVGTASSTGNGGDFRGGLTSGDGVTGTARAGNGRGGVFTGDGSGAGLSSTGGATGPGGLFSSGGSGAGLSSTGGTTGPGGILAGGGGTTSPTSAPLRLTQTTNAPSSPSAGDVWISWSSAVSTYMPTFYMASARQLVSGTIVLAAGSSTRAGFEATAVCTCTDQTNAIAVRCIQAAGTLAVVSASSTAADTVAFVCF